MKFFIPVAPYRLYHLLLCCKLMTHFQNTKNQGNKSLKGHSERRCIKQALQPKWKGNARAGSRSKSSPPDSLKIVKGESEAKLKSNLGTCENTFFFEKMEVQLMSRPTEVDSRLMPLTRKEFLKLAFET